MSEVGSREPMRHGLAQYAALVLFVETSPRIHHCTLAGNDQHVAVTLTLGRFQEAPQRRMRLTLLHAVQIEPRLDGEMTALELACRAPVERLASRCRSRLRGRLQRVLDCGRTLLCLGLRCWFRQIDLANRRPLVEWPRAAGHPRPPLGRGP